MSWTAELLSDALNKWNETMDTIWDLLLQSTEEFKGGGIWNTIVDINGAMQAVGYGLLILFFCMGIFRSAVNFRDFRRPEFVFRHFIYFVAAKAAITYGLELMQAVFTICAGIANEAIGYLGGTAGAAATLPQEIIQAIEDAGFWETIPLWMLSLIGTGAVTLLSFVLILVIYGRFFRIYLYTAMSPLALATFGGEATMSTGKAFLKSYAGVCLSGVMIILACIIFTAMASTGTPAIEGGSPVVMVWNYIKETAFNMAMLTILIFTSNSVVKEMFGL